MSSSTWGSACAARIISQTILLAIFATFTALAASPSVCELAKKRGGLTAYAVDASPNQNGDREIVADFDGDGSRDKISWFDPGSGSIIPADNSTVTLTLSSSGDSFTVEEQRLYVVKYQSKYFVVAGRVESERGPWHSDVYAITGKGMQKICSFGGKGLGQ
jgi:hypothetical protein